MPGPIGLLEIRRQKEKVDVGGGKYLEVEGLSADDVATLLERFPGLQDIVTGRGMALEDLRAMAPGAIGAIIALGVGKPGDEAHEKFASKITLELQQTIIEAIGKATC